MGSLMLFHFIIHRGWGYLEREKVSVKRERVELRHVATTFFLISPKISSIDSMERIRFLSRVKKYFFQGEIYNEMFITFGFLL